MVCKTPTRQGIALVCLTPQTPGHHQTQRGSGVLMARPERGLQTFSVITGITGTMAISRDVLDPPFTDVTLFHLEYTESELDAFAFGSSQANPSPCVQAFFGSFLNTPPRAPFSSSSLFFSCEFRLLVAGDPTWTPKLPEGFRTGAVAAVD